MKLTKPGERRSFAAYPRGSADQGGQQPPKGGAMIHLAVLVLMGSSFVAAEQAAGPGVKAIGVYPLLLPGLQAIPAGRPRVYLWCHGMKLLGVMVPDERQQKAVTTAQGRSLPSALLLRDGRCGTDGGGVSFGFVVPMKAWIFD